MAKKLVYEEVCSKKFSRDVTIEDVSWMILYNNAKITDKIWINEYDASGDNVVEAEILIWRYRDETDQEYVKRMEETERVKKSASSINDGGLLSGILVPEEKYNELVEKAWKYDELCK